MSYTNGLDDPSKYFQTVIWTGDGAADTRTISFDGNSNMQPDWVWHKQRNDTYGNHVFDSSRGFGANKELVTRGNFIEGDTGNFNTGANGYVDAAASNGFVVKKGTGGVGNVYINQSGDTHVAWSWKANGGTTASNTDGSITSTIQANPTAGFNILTYTGTGSAATVGHGLGVVPKLVIYKRRSAIENWGVYHPSTGNTGCCFLNLTIAKSTSSSYFNNTSPTSTTLSFGTNPAFNGNGSTHVAYCFAEIQGYSKFGSYIGNGSTNGTFVYTGFKPAWVMCKSTASTSDWYIYDNKREGYNVDNDHLLANCTAVEATADEIDILSNGFKLRIATDPNVAEAYIYMAFAESPFVSSAGVPTTAR